MATTSGTGAVNSPYYSITFLWDDIDFSLCVDRVHIVNSIDAVYQVFIIEAGIRAKDILDYDLHGQKKMKVIVELKTEDAGESVESFETELILQHTLGDLSIMPEKEEDGADHAKVNRGAFFCIPTVAYKMTTQSLNALAPNNDPKSPFDMVMDLVKKYITDADVTVDDRNANKYKGEQLMVPASNFGAALDHIQEHYGIYKGYTYFQCVIEENRTLFHMWDLSKIIKDEPLYKVYFLSQGKKDSEVMKEVGKDDKSYHTYLPIQTFNRENEIVARISKTQQHMISPNDDLFSIIELDVENVWKENAVRDGGELKLSDTVKETQDFLGRYRVGVDYSDANLTSKIAKEISHGMEREFKLDRNLRLKNLMKVGYPIEFVPESVEYGGVQGKYVIQSSRISLVRDTVAHWNAMVTIRVFRGNAMI